MCNNDENNMYKKLHPFKWFCLENFPFIEEDFDAITEYQLLCKIVCYLNKTITKTNELGTEVEALNNWFVNLDVQDEINNKLDEMTEDGTLARIINEQIFEQLNTDISNLAERVTTNETNIQNIQNSLNPVDFYSGKNMVVFGDSFTDPDNNNSLDGYWVNSVASTTGMTAFNFAKGAASLMRVSNSYRMQVTRALNEMTATQKANTSIVIMYLADTDILEDVNLNQYITEYVDLCDIIHTNFPNAKIIVAPFTWRCNKLFYSYYKKMTDFIFHMKRWSTFPVVFLRNCMYWLLGLTGYYQNEYHPNEAGYKVIANKFVNAIYGGDDGDTLDYYNLDISNLDNVTDDRRCTIEVKNGIIHMEFYATFSVDKENAYDWIYLPAVAIPQPDIMVGLYTADGNFVGTGRLTKSNSRMNIKLLNVPANTTVFMQPLTYRAVANFDYSS